MDKKKQKVMIITAVAVVLLAGSLWYFTDKYGFGSIIPPKAA